MSESERNIDDKLSDILREMKEIRAENNTIIKGMKEEIKNLTDQVEKQNTIIASQINICAMNF